MANDEWGRKDGPQSGPYELIICVHLRNLWTNLRGVAGLLTRTAVGKPVPPSPVGNQCHTGFFCGDAFKYQPVKRFIRTDRPMKEGGDLVDILGGSCAA